MTVQVLSRRSSVLRDRPNPTLFGDGELIVNLNVAEPGLFFRDSTGSGLVKAGPIFVGTSAPNSPPAGFSSYSTGESWLDKSSTFIFKIYDGTGWQTPKAIASTSTSGFPANPIDGQLHYDKSVSTLYIYNVTTASWVAV